MTLPAFVAARRTGQTDIRQLHRPIYNIISCHTSVNRPYLINDWHRFIEKPALEIQIFEPLTVSCFSKIHIGFIFLVPAHPGSPGQRAVKRVCVCVLRR